MNRPPLPRPQRILMTADTVGGVWTYALELCRALAEYEVEVLLATMGARLSPDQERQAAEVQNLTVAESNFKLEWMEDPWDDVEAAGQWLLALSKRFQPDVIHLNGYAHGLLDFCRPVLVGAHSCVLSWWAAVKGGAAPPRWNEYARRVELGLRSAQLVVSPSDSFRRSLLRHYGELEHLVVIRNGRHFGRFRPGTKENLVLSVGRLWDPAKNATALAQIAPKLPWPVWIAGDAAGPDGGISAFENVHLPGRLGEDALAEVLGRAGIYALPAYYEPFGLSVLEAALCGCALVLGDIPSLRENWEGAALFVSPSDVDALEKALKALMNDATWRGELGQSALERAAQFDASSMGQAYWLAYRQLMEAYALVELDLERRS